MTTLDDARALADEVLFPTAIEIDALPLIPKERLDVLADAGWYGFMVPKDAGGLGLDWPAALRAVEIFAGGCLTTTLVWIQHIAGVMTALGGPPALHDEWFAPLCSGERRAGIALGGLKPGPPALRATQTDGGWLLDGESPWVSGWGRIDIIVAASRTAVDNVVNVFVDAEASATLTVTPHRLVAVNASGTVSLGFAQHFVPDERVTHIEPFAGHAERDAERLGLNGSLALGVAGRCLRLLGPSPLDDQLDGIRQWRDAAPPETMPAARATAAAFAMQAASSLVASTGSRSVLLDEHAQRLAREAMFLLVFGTRPTIRAELLNLLGASTPAS